MYIFGQEVQSIWKDDYAANQLLRKKFRERKHEVKAQEKKDSDLKEKGALDVTLVPERVEDIELAKKIRYRGGGWLKFSIELRYNYIKWHFELRDVNDGIFNVLSKACSRDAIFARARVC